VPSAGLLSRGSPVGGSSQTTAPSYPPGRLAKSLVAALDLKPSAPSPYSADQREGETVSSKTILRNGAYVIAYQTSDERNRWLPAIWGSINGRQVHMALRLGLTPQQCLPAGLLIALNDLVRKQHVGYSAGTGQTRLTDAARPARNFLTNEYPVGTLVNTAIACSMPWNDDYYCDYWLRRIQATPDFLYYRRSLRRPPSLTGLTAQEVAAAD